MQITGGFRRVGIWPSFIIFFLLNQRLGLAPAALCATAFGGGQLGFASRGGSVNKLEAGVLAFWGAGLAAALFRPEWGAVYFRDYFTTFLYLALLAAALLPLLLGGEPFTSAFAKRKTDPTLWSTWQFIRINQIMTLGWAGIFLAGLLLGLHPEPLVKIAAPILISLLVGIPFTRKFPDWFMSHVQRDPFRKKGLPAAQKFTQLGAESAATPLVRAASAGQLGPIKKALVIFGSPRGAQGHTYTMLQELIRGMTDGGIVCETVMLNEQRIKPCAGCFSCWTKTPGRCIHNDDMAALLDREAAADLLIFAQPLYIFSVPGITKNYLDRRLPRIQPYLIERSDGATTHPHRDEHHPRRLVIFSVCGFPELSHFAGLLTMFRQLATAAELTVVGEILRPASESLRFGARLGKHQEILAALHQAGTQLARQGYVGAATEAAISQQLFAEVGSFRSAGNALWDTWIDYEEKRRRGAVLPEREQYFQEDPGLFFHGMASQFNPHQADGFSGTIQFTVTDREPGNFQLTVKDGVCLCTPGTAAAAKLTIASPLAVWLAIAEGKLSGMAALREGLYQASGDFGLLSRLPEIFDGGVAA
ncbi:MAG: hypothetical protein HGA96_11505 [Desulfobulbaceae bacterium]|nr:hypothetical protein [Desulfobulbaceae bacterium]